MSSPIPSTASCLRPPPVQNASQRLEGIALGLRRFVSRRGMPDLVARLLHDAPASGEDQRDQREPARQERRRDGRAIRTD